jgi:hypothetical protein
VGELTRNRGVTWHIFFLKRGRGSVEMNSVGKGKKKKSWDTYYQLNIYREGGSNAFNLILYE